MENHNILLTAKQNDKQTMPEIEKPTVKIQALRAAIEAVIGSVNTRLKQIQAGPEVDQAIGAWIDANTKVAHAAEVGMRSDVLLSLFDRLLEASAHVMLLAEERTDLDLDEENEKFQALTDAWITSHPQNERTSTAAPDPLSPATELFMDDLLDLSTKIEKITLSSRDAHSKLRALEDKFGVEIAPLKDKYQAAVAAFDKVEPELNDRAAKLDELIRLQGQKVLAGRYEVDADNEEKIANWFRYGTLTVMAAVIVLIGLSYYEVSEFTLSPVQAGIRIVFSLILSVPAAYLARESAKHRQRQYVLRQTALEIGAIDSYIQTLPIESQHKIKEATAIKLFTPQKLDNFDKDSYPINAQELFLKFIDAAAELKKNISPKKEAKNDGA